MSKSSPTSADAGGGGFGRFLYNPRTGEVLSRTPASWGKIGLFYLLYYTGLACFFAALLAIFLTAFTDDKAPVLTGKHSVLPPRPEMGIQPMPDAGVTLVQFSVDDAESQDPFIKGMETYLTTGQGPDRPTSIFAVNYLDPDMSTHRSAADCAKDDPSTVTVATKPCAFNVSALEGFLAACPRNDFGFRSGTPCLAIKMNRVYEYVPEITDGSDEVKIVCKGEHIADRDNVGEMEYWPKSADGVSGSIPKYFFPFVGQADYMTPHVFVHFKSTTKNVLVQVVCQPTNLDVPADDHKGKIHFELYVTTKS